MSRKSRNLRKRLRVEEQRRRNVDSRHKDIDRRMTEALMLERKANDAMHNLQRHTALAIRIDPDMRRDNDRLFCVQVTFAPEYLLRQQFRCTQGPSLLSLQDFAASLSNDAMERLYKALMEHFKTKTGF